MERTERVDVGDVELECRIAGDGPVVLLAHGFPDCARSFRAQVPALVRAGYRAITPTMRGYAPSGIPTSGRFDAASLGSDLRALARHYSPGAPVRLVGHDWGAIAAYAATAGEPSLFSHLVTIAVPHLRTAARAFVTPGQLRRSWYIGFFQLRGVADRRLRADDLAFVDRLWRDWSPGYAADPAELALVKAAIGPRIEAVLGYYRALLSARALVGASRRLLLSKTRVPALYLHGERDGCVGVSTVAGVERAYASGVSVRTIPEAGHFVHLERPELVNAILLEFLR